MRGIEEVYKFHMQWKVVWLKIPQSHAFSCVHELDQCFMMSCKLSYRKIVIIMSLCNRYIPPKNIISE